MDRLSFSERVKAVGLPLDKIVVIASGVLDAYGIREADDIDLAVEAQLFAELGSVPGWSEEHAEWGEVYYRKGDCEAWAGWTEPDSDRPLYEDLLPDTIEIDSVRYMTLDYVRAWKARKRRQKDLADIALIDTFKETYHDS